MIGGACAMTVACGTDAGLCDNNRCVGQDGGDDGALGDGSNVGDGSNQADGQAPVDGSTIDAPPGCDLAREPKDSAACVADAVGVFVDAAGGLDTNNGTKAKPFQTIAKAIASAGAKPRVYVCAGSYTDNVVLDATHAPSVYGGFACGGWSYATSNAVVVKPAAGYPLHVDGVTTALSVSDIEFDAPTGTAAAPNSIAGFVNASPSLILRRLKLVAGAGGTPADQGPPTTNYPAAAPNGKSGDNGGAGGANTCTDATTSKGGNGGVAATAATAGGPNLGSGAPGANSATCNGGGGAGKEGANAAAPAANVAPAHVGALTAAGWAPSTGTKGNNGGPGQGGGGGGDGIANNGTGGGGGAGGCGGAGATGGAGGGTSIALVTVGSAVTLQACTLQSGAGGTGAKGGDGETAQGTGNNGGAGAMLAGCAGGQGGAGAGAKGGGGGAGGASFGLLFSGAAPTLDGAAAATAATHAGVIAGTKGGPGGGGAAGGSAMGGLGQGNGGNTGAAGPDGIAAAVQQFEGL